MDLAAEKAQLRAENARLRRENSALQADNAELRQQLALLAARLQEVEAQLAQDSHNSNWPSSRDKNRKHKRTKSLRRKSQRRPGGQPGHEGETLKMSIDVDERVRHRPDRCATCQAPLATVAATTVQRRQVFDIPPVRVQVTEHEVHQLSCPRCGTLNSGCFPAGVKQPVQYGPRLKALSVYLMNQQLLPYDRTRQLLADLFGRAPSTGSLRRFVAEAVQGVAGMVAAIQAALRQVAVLHCDESGFYINGRRHWLHAASTPSLSYFQPDHHRGRKATDAVDILAHFQGTAVHDNWSAYLSYDRCHHALCNVHHLRELTYIHEQFEQKWASDFKRFLLACKRLVARARADGRTALSAATRRAIDTRYDSLIAQALLANPPPDGGWPQGQKGRPKKTKARNLAERFDRLRTFVLAFVDDFDVPFDNNLVERDIRMLKVQQKISGCFRSWQGALEFCKLRSYLDTLRKQGTVVLPSLIALFSGHPVMPALHAE